jgi:hypothetical protein
MSPRLSRRGFLAGLAVGIAGAVLGLRLYWTAGHTPAGAERLVRLLPHAESAARLGRRYLEDTPQEAHARRLIALIGTTPADMESDAALRERLQARIRQDFIDGATVTVDGWRLAVTEARLCALVSVLQDAPSSSRPG